MKKCILPWIHLEATSTGEVKPCCIYKNSIQINQQNASLNNHSLNEIWNSDDLNDLRKQFLDNKMPSGCASCWEAESVGKISKRLVSLKQFSHHLHKFNKDLEYPAYLDLKLGTVCNLKCRSCSTFSSFRWAEDEEKLHGKLYNQNLKSYWIDDDSNFWHEIEELLPHIEHFDFTGGEPFLIKKHFEILKKCVEKGYAKNITVHYNTNGTVKITETMFKIWENFKNVEIMFSADGIEEKFEYLRNPGKWNDFVEIFESTLLRKNISVNICYSLTIFNVMYMYEFINWFNQYNLPEDKLYFNLIWQPDYLSIKSLSTETKIKIKNFLLNHKIDSDYFNKKVSEIIDFMFFDGQNLQKYFLQVTSKLDEIRNEDFRKTFIELGKIL